MHRPSLIEGVVRALRRHPGNRLLQSLAFRLAAGEKIGTLIGGHPILLDLEQFVDRWIYMYGTYEEAATRYLSRIARPGWHFVDVGACEGYYSVLACSLGGSTSRVLAVEPNPSVASRLQRTITLGDYPIELVVGACGREEAVLPLTLSDVAGNIGMSSLVHSDRGSRAIAVPVQTLDDLCTRYCLKPMVVKVDVEGANMAVLEGFGGTLKRSPPATLLVEVGVDDGDEDVIRYLGGFGYVACRIRADGSVEGLTHPPRSGSVEVAAFVYER